MLVGAFVGLGSSRAVAGPPFVTDDPEPTEYRHWEIYTGLQYENEGDGEVSASVPFAEFNYGALPNVQVTLSTQSDSDDAGTAHRYGYGATEFGLKARFVQESKDRPQIAFYPSVEIPGSGGHAVTFLPVWLQKSSGPWTVYGGGGLYLNSGPGMRDYSFAGAAVEREISRGITVGGELYHAGAAAVGETDTTAANVGMIAQLGNYHAILFSLGRSLHGSNTFSTYASYEFALGPGE
jgi:hypothetical protein